MNTALKPTPATWAAPFVGCSDSRLNRPSGEPAVKIMTKQQAQIQTQPTPPQTHARGIAETSVKTSEYAGLNTMTSDPLFPLPTATNHCDVGPLDQSTALKLLLVNRIMLQGYITAITGDRTLSEDVFQEVSMVVMEKFATVISAESFRPWVRSIARLQSLKAVNQRQAYNAFLTSDTIDQLDKAWDERERENPPEHRPKPHWKTASLS